MNKKSTESNCVIVWTTLSDRSTADRMATQLVEASLAACVQVEPEVMSFYRWNGKLCRETESRLAIKTHRTKIAALIHWLDEHHPYDEPEILVTPVEQASSGYERFISLQVGGNGLVG